MTSKRRAAKSNRGMKDSRLLLVLLVIFIVLAVLVALPNHSPATTPAVANTCPDCVFTGLQLSDIQAIRLRSPETGQTFSLARAEDGSWTAPDSTGTLNATEADLIARTMVLLPFSRTLPLGTGDDKTVYGFTPEGVLSIEMVAGGVSHAVAVGYRTPTEDSYYALIDDRPNLYLLARAPIDYLIARLKSPPVA